jgi:hypothetical protein
MKARLKCTVRMLYSFFGRSSADVLMSIVAGAAPSRMEFDTSFVA